MKPIATVLLVAATLLHGAWAADAPPGPQPPLLGAWAVDTTRLPMPPQSRPRSVTITFSAEGPDRLRTRVEVVDPTGARLEADGVTPLDGSPTPVKANFEADVSATTMPRPEVLVMQLGRNGSPASTRIYAVAADGQTMTETVAYFSPDGQPVLRRNHFSRLR
ncbi:hypothetical protein AACH10_03120 [Ideonella sp. DXS22W]|uniref:LuxR family transcriptional regulator n=1 Tax=Pseudaquabacterium inlustre TaxID=2984192 RepID=A0ABU9CC19_9BURK